MGRIDEKQASLKYKIKNRSVNDTVFFYLITPKTAEMISCLNGNIAAICNKCLFYGVNLLYIVAFLHLFY